MFPYLPSVLLTVVCCGVTFTVSYNQKYALRTFHTTQQKAMDKTLSIAFLRQKHTKRKHYGIKGHTVFLSDEIRAYRYTLYSAQCFIGLKCTELSFLLS